MSTTVDKRNLTAEIADNLRKSNRSPEALAFLSRLESAQLPAQKSEEYKFAPITRILERNFQEWPGQRTPDVSDLDIASAIPAGLKTNLIVFVNGNWSKELSKTSSKGLLIRSESSVSIQSEDPFALLNGAAASGEVHLEVAADVSLEDPICILYVLDTSQGTVASTPRVVMNLEPNSKAVLIQRTVQKGTYSSFQNQVEEIHVKEKAHLDYYKIQDTAQHIQVTNTQIRQHTASQVNTFTLTLDGIAVRNNLCIAIDGEQCESHFHGLYLLKGDTLADNHTVVDHLKPNSFSNEMYKGVMDDQSKGVFNGKIFVRPHAQKTNAFQSNRNILLSDKATVNTKPQLEIWADDVKCSHGCTTGQLDEEAMFYLQTRGIPKETSRAMLLYAFASEVLMIVPDTALRAYMDDLVADRLHKTF